MPKPLTRLFGLTFIERSILACQQVGIQEFYVVTGCYEEAVLPHIQELERRLDIPVRPVYCSSWKEGNGTSLLAVSPFVSGPFLLLMCDHLFDPDILRCLMRAPNDDGCCLLAVDRRLDQIWDLTGSTKVRLGREAIVAIGKGITEFDAVDTGLFLCQPAIFTALETARREGDCSVSAGVRNLIPGGEIRAVDIGDRYWLDVDTPEDLAHARRFLLDRLSKPSEDGFAARYLNRPISQRISGLLARTSIRPNTITVLSFLMCVSGALLLSFGQYLYTAIAGVLIQLGSIVDGCDGEIARLKLQTSRFGAWFDTILDRYADVLVAVGISYGYWQAHPSATTWLIGIMALTGFVLASYMKKEYALRFLEKPPHGILSKLIKRDFRLLALAVAALLNHPFHGLAIVGAISHLGIGWTFLKTYRSQKRIQPRR